jgi:hypothetical protein
MARHLRPRAKRLVTAIPGPRYSCSDARRAEVAGGFILELTHLAGNLLHEPYTAILLREHGVRRIRTRYGFSSIRVFGGH